MPSRAKANTVFFCASVVSTWALSPSVCAAVKSPRRLELTLRSTSSCRGVLRSTATTRTSAFPYWLRPSTIPMTHCCTWNVAERSRSRAESALERLRSTAPVRRVGERAEQQRDVVVLGGLGDAEGDHDLRGERLPALLGEPRPGSEHQPGAAERCRALDQATAAVVVGDPFGDQLLTGEQPDGDPHGRPAVDRVQDVRRHAHEASPRTLEPVICASCSVVSARSVSSSLPSRRVSSASISSGE